MPEAVPGVTISTRIGTLGLRRGRRTTSASTPRRSGVDGRKARGRLVTSSRRLGLPTRSICSEGGRVGVARGRLRAQIGSVEKPCGPRLLRRRRERTSPGRLRMTPRRDVTLSRRDVTWSRRLVTSSRSLVTPIGPLATFARWPADLAPYPRSFLWSRTSRTLRVSEVGVKGFCRNATSESSTPWSKTVSLV